MSREAILKRVQQNKPAAIALPDLSVFTHNISEEQLIADFIKTSTGNNSTVVSLVNEQVDVNTYVQEFVAKNFGTDITVFNSLDTDRKEHTVDFTHTPVDLFITSPKVAVAENGCMWVDEKILVQRIAAFASEHTLFLVDHTLIVPTMHQAYQKISINENGYGVFIGGPSKTADIEQSLVVGAQGAVSNTVILY